MIDDLYDLELYKFDFFREFRWISQIWEATTVKRMKIDPHRARQRCNSLNLNQIKSKLSKAEGPSWSLTLP